MAIATTNPATGQVERTFTPHDETDVDRRFGQAHDAFLAMKKTSFAQRAEWMNLTADALETDVDCAARLLTLEMGKPLIQARAEVLKSAKAMRFYAEHAEEFLTGRSLPDPSAVNATAAYTRYEAMGVVLTVMPWNYPIWQVVRFAALALMAGNAGLLKHASNVPQAAIYLDTLFHEGGFPAGSFQSLLIPAAGVERVARDKRVAAMTLTGSEPAGRSLAAIAGSEVKPVVLELGGSDPFIVAPSADLDGAVSTAVAARTSNNGQACINAKRFIVHQDVYDTFIERFTTATADLVVGDPFDDGTDVGPLATESNHRDLEELVTDAREKGAPVVTGGVIPDGDGWFYPPTVVAGITPEMRLYAEEAFGPLAALYRVADRDEALALANATTFGLSSAVWTQDLDDEEFFVNGLAAGAVVVNGMSISYPELPFGGLENSVVGHELSLEGIRAFCNLKSVWRG